MDKYRRINILTIIFTLLVLIIGVKTTFSKQSAAFAEGEINYNQLIYIESTEQGYQYKNYGGQYVVNNDDSLTVIIANILDNATNDVQLSFDIENNTEELILNINTGKTLSFNGNFNSIKPNGAVINLQSGKLNWNGLTLESSTQGLIVGIGAELVFNSGNILVNSSQSSSAVIIRGIAKIMGKVAYNELSTSFGYGIEIDTQGSVTLDGVALVEGHSGILVNGELNVISAGTIKANKTSNDNTSAGIALRISGAGDAIISSGNYTTNGGSAIYMSGDSNSFVEVNAGTFTGGIKIADNAGTTLKLNGKFYKSNVHHGLDINTISNSFTISTTSWQDIIIDTFLSFQTNGFRKIGWIVENFEGIISNETFSTITLENFYENDTIAPWESNLYKLEFYDRNGNLIEQEEDIPYATLFDLQDKASASPGFDFVGWSAALGGETAYTNSIIIEDDYKLYKKEELSKPQFDVIENISRVYQEGSEDTITITPTHALEVNYTYVWQKKEGDTFQDTLNTTNSLQVSAVLDSGIYKIKITSKYLEESTEYISETFSNEILVNIEKASYVDISYQGAALSGVYDPLKTLANYVLEGDFLWKNSSIIPTCNISTYQAIYNADSNNYNDYELGIPLTLTKAIYNSVDAHESFIGANLIYDPNKTLEDFVLNANYYWDNPSEVPNCSKTIYNAYYNADKNNYENKALTIIIQLQKADYPDEKKNCTINITIAKVDYGFNLYYLEVISEDMPEGYSFNLLESEMKNYPLTVGQHIFNNCSYNIESEKENYNELTATITVNVAKANYSEKTHPILTGVYNKTQTLNSFVLENNYSWKNANIIPTCDVNSYLAVFSDPELTDYYNDYELYIEVDLEKGDYIAEDVSLHPDLNGEYNKDQTLNSFLLQENYRWTNPQIVPTVDITNYSALYNGDSVNYNDYETEINLILQKASYDISGISLTSKTVIYDGKQHYLRYEGDLPEGITFDKYDGNDGWIESGTYTITIILIQADIVNYKLINNDIKGVLIISKAPSVIIAEERQSFVYDGKKKYVNAMVSNTEQKLLISNDGFTDKGLYTVILSTTESTNYLAGQKEITVFINTPIKQIGESTAKITKAVGEVAFGMLENPSGLECDVELTMEYENTEIEGIKTWNSAILKVNLTKDGQTYAYKQETYKITVLLPDKLKRSELSVSYLDSEGNRTLVASSVNGNCLIIESDKIGDFVIEKVKEPLAWWAWLLISLAIVTSLGAGFYILFRFKDKIFKKNKLNDDIIQSVSENLQNESEKDDNV